MTGQQPPATSPHRMTDTELDTVLNNAGQQLETGLRQSIDTDAHLSSTLAGVNLKRPRKAFERLTKRPVSSIRPGDHAWLAFSNKPERDRVIGAFIREAFDTNEKVVYITNGDPGQLAGVLPNYGYNLPVLTRTGQLRFIPREEACLDSRGRFDHDQMTQTLEEQVGEAFDQGYRAVRITTDLTWTLNKSAASDLTRILHSEERFSEKVFATSMAMVICQVDRRRCTQEELAALEDAHEFLVEANPEYDDGVLRITRTFAPPGLRIDGEVDAARLTILNELLKMTNFSDEPVHLDLSRLAFIDLGGLNMLAHHASQLPKHAPLILDDVSPEVMSVIEMIGWHRLPGLLVGRR
ncbi:MEDS domain-containing protein [Actinomadura sediminis]|uniref:MEDS domain-containing protein n=1 Tax=Actinomadura sediminis TaxID=1038904 RepID=A0ABW3EFY9_9ACTN